MSKTKLFIFFIVSFISGVFINNFFWNDVISFFILLLLVVFFIFFFIYTKKYIKLIIFFVFGFFIGIIFSWLNIENITKNLCFIENYSGRKTNLTLEIKSIKSINDNYKVYIAKLYDTNLLTEVHLKTNYKLKKGQIIKTNSKIYTFKNTPSFNYKNYMLSKGIYFKVYPYNYEIVGENKVFFLEEEIIKIRTSFLNIAKKIYTKQEAIFLGGILFGAREDMPKGLKTNFNNSGLTHLIAVSGFNITILIIFFGLFLRFFPNFIKITFMIIFIFLFVLLVGANIPVIRAALMGIIGFIALSLGRNSNIFALVLLVAFVMILFFPLSINYDISFHLSFLAVLGIIFLQPYLDKKLKFITNILEIRDSITLSFSALSFCLPVIIFGFGQLSVVVILTNLLVAWTIPITMLFGFLSIIVYYFSTTIGIFIGYFARILLRWDIFVVNFFGSRNWSNINFDFSKYGGYLEFIFLLFIAFLVLFLKSDNGKNYKNLDG